MITAGSERVLDSQCRLLLLALFPISSCESSYYYLRRFIRQTRSDDSLTQFAVAKVFPGTNVRYVYRSWYLGEQTSKKSEEGEAKKQETEFCP
jgi:hypothetical protein